MKRALLFILVVLAACDKPPSAEPAPAFPSCDTSTQAVQPFLYGELTLGTMVNGQYQAFADGAEVEVAPYSNVDDADNGGWYFKEVYARFTTVTNEDLGPSICADLSRSDGFPMTKRADGSYVGGPFFLDAELEDGQLAVQLGTPMELFGEVMLGMGTRSVIGYLTPRLHLVRVNREGFLGVPLPPMPPDAGPIGGGVLELGLSQIVARPGEDVHVLLSIDGARNGESVTLAVDPLPAGVSLALPASVPPHVRDLDLRLSVASTVGPMSIPLHLVAQGSTTRGERDSFINVVPAVEREVAVSVFGPDAPVPLGSTASVSVHLAPLAGFSGNVWLVAEAPVELDVTLPSAAVPLTAPMDVTVQVRPLAPNPGGVRFYAVAGREVWGNDARFALATTDPLQSHVVLQPGFSTRRVIEPGGTLQWQVQAYELGSPTSRPVQLSVTGVPADCSLLNPDAGAQATRTLTISCDAGLPASAATLNVTAAVGTTTEQASWRLSIAGSEVGYPTSLAPEPRPQALDSEWPTVAGLVNERLELGVESNDFGPAVMRFDAGFVGDPAMIYGDGLRMVSVGYGLGTRAVRVTRLQGRFFADGVQGGPTNAVGPFDADATGGTVWAATGVAGTGLWVGHLASGAWVDDGASLPAMPGLTDLALTTWGNQVVLVTAEPQLVVRRHVAGAWTTLPAFPAQLVAPAHTPRKTGRRVLDVAIDNTGEPVVVLITSTDQLEAWRLEAGAWVKLNGLSVGAGLLPLSVSVASNSLSTDVRGKLTVVWHEASRAYAVTSGARVLPLHAPGSRLRAMRHGAAGFFELAQPGIDLDGGAPEQPHVTFDRDSIPWLSWVENGRVYVNRVQP